VSGGCPVFPRRKTGRGADITAANGLATLAGKRTSGINVVAADTDEKARRLFTTVEQSFTNLVRGAPGKVQEPIDNIEEYWTPAEKRQASRMLEYSIVGSPETVRRELESFAALTNADELMVVCSVYDHLARIRSYEIVAEIAD